MARKKEFGSEVIGCRVRPKGMRLVKTDAMLPPDLEAEDMFFFVVGIKGDKALLRRHGSVSEYEYPLKELDFEPSVKKQIAKMYEVMSTF